MSLLRDVCNRLRPAALGATAILLLSASAAFAAEAEKGQSEVVFIGQLILLMLIGRLIGEGMQWLGQPSVMGMLVGGIVLGPSLLGWLLPDVQHAIFPKSPEQKAMLDGISQFGILLLLLLTGMETDLKLVKKVGKAAISISLTGVAVPFICGFTLGHFMPDSLLPDPNKRLLTSLFLGTALSISSIKIVAAIVREMGFTRRNLGQIIVASAICEDSLGWVIIAITFSLAEAGTIDLISVGKALIGTAIFLAFSLTIGRRIVFFLIRWANDNFRSEFPVITMILVIMGVMSLTTHFIGVHTVLGAFVAGVLIGESPILSKHIDEQLRGLIMAFFMPVFFGAAGLTADLTVLKDPELALMGLGLIAIASLGKFAGAFVGGEIGGLTRREALALACGMNARGSTEVIVATIGLSMGALSQNLFTMIVAMAVITTMAMPPMLRWGLSRVPIRKEERERLEREEFEEKGFVPNLERLLLAVDDSPNGKFASRLAGLIGGPRGMPTTVMPLHHANGVKQPDTKKAEPKKAEPKKAATKESEAKPSDETPAKETTSADVVKATAKSAHKPDKEEAPSTPPDVIVRKPEKSPAEAIAGEAEKGYDLLLIGVEHTKAKNGTIHEEVNEIASAFDGPLLIAAARDHHLKHPEECPLRILVPVAGTDVSRRAAEVAIAIARACKSPVTALYVSAKRTNGSRPRRGPTRQQEQAILKEIVEIADRYDYEIQTASSEGLAENAIIAAAKKGGCDLIVMGVTRRAGDSLNFGETAAAVFDKSPASVVFVSS